MARLLPVMYNVIKISERGHGGDTGFGWEGINDIYTFFRMFRTFKKKRALPCKGGYQHNIIYMSHLDHSLKIMYMMKELFGLRQPAYSESVDDIVNMPNGSGGALQTWRRVTDSRSNVAARWSSDINLDYDINIPVVPLGKAARTPKFFN